MPRPLSLNPTYRHHKQSGQAIVTVRDVNGNRKDVLLGRYKSPESLTEFRRICELVNGNAGRYPSDKNEVTVAEVLVKYIRFAIGYYGDGSCVYAVKRSLKTVRELYGAEPAIDFGPKALKSCQEQWVVEGITRKSVNKMTGQVKRAWRWLVAEELIPAECYHRLLAVEGLRAGRTKARDNPPVRPAVAEDVEAAIGKMPPMVADVVRLQILTGARCGELLSMRANDVDRSGTIWIYSPSSHKGTWRGKGRVIQFGPESQKILAPLLLRAGDGFVFSPARSEADRHAKRSEERETPRWESHMRRNKNKRIPNPKRTPRERYATSTLRRAIERACDVAGVPRFTPHRLRHLAAHKIREQFGLEHCRATLGHTVAAMSAHYSGEVDRKLSAEVAAKVG